MEFKKLTVKNYVYESAMHCCEWKNVDSNKSKVFHD